MIGDTELKAILDNQDRMFDEQLYTRQAIDKLTDSHSQARVDIAGLKETVKINSQTSARAITKLEALAADVGKLHVEQSAFKAKVMGVVLGGTIAMQFVWGAVKDLWETSS